MLLCLNAAKISEKKKLIIISKSLEKVGYPNISDLMLKVGNYKVLNEHNEKSKINRLFLFNILKMIVSANTQSYKLVIV